MPNSWKTVRVFISSTFRDMHAERDHLIKVTFPALREQLLPYRVELYDIDLRWGITEDEAKNEKVIDLCLEQVDECRPFFLAFLGHRYGWVPGQVPADTQQRFPFVKQFPGVSVTELELRHGVMLDPTGKQALLLLRKDDALTTIPEATRKRDFLEADPRLQQQLAALKQELEAGPLPVQPYSARWDPKRYDRVNRTEGKLHGLDDFGKQVEHWLWQAIKQQLQLPDGPAPVDALQAEADLHERFLELRTRIYIGRDDLYRQLHDFALACGTFPLLLSGASGLGKSAALARFVRDFRKEHPDVLVLPHFVGASPRTTSLAGMLQRLTQELQRHFQLPLPKAETPEETIRTFTVAITSLPESARVVLVFDALNQLDADSRAETLVWLPERLPPNVRVLCSAAIGPQQAPRVLTAFGQREHIDVPLRPLTDDERRAIIQSVPKLVAKTLDAKQIDALLANPATDNPLFLMVALEELRGYSSFERLNQMIAGLPPDGDKVTQMFDQVFERLEQEFNKPLVIWTLCVLACSRRGLSGPELVELTRSLGEQADDLYPVLRQLRPYLQVRDGLFDFYHISIRRAVESRYLLWKKEEDQRDPWARWNPARQPPARETTPLERVTRQQLIDFFGTTPLASRSVDELPWQMSQLKNWQRLFDLIGDVTFFDAAWQTNELDVRTTWSMVKTLGGLEPIEAYRAVLANPADYDGDTLWNLAVWLQTSGHGDVVSPLWTFLLQNFRSSGDDSGYHRCLGNQAGILEKTGDLDGALRLLKEMEAICRRLNDPAGLHTCLGNQAVILQRTGDLDGALQLFKEKEAICRQLNDPAGLYQSLGNQAGILEKTGDLDEALRLLKGVEAICHRLNDPVGLAITRAKQAGILQDTGDLDGALRLLKEQEAICRRFNDPAGLQACLGNQALIQQATGDRDGALRLLKEQETICRRLNDPASFSYSLGNQAAILQATGDLDGALRLRKEQEAICRRLNDPAGLGSSLGGQAVILKDTGDLDGAMRLLHDQEAICRRLNDPAGLQACLGNQALIQQDIGNPDAAMQLFKDQEAICRRLNDPAGLQRSLGNQGVILQNAGDLGEAMRLHKEKEAICRRLNDPAALYRSLGNQALILQVTGDLRGAMRLLKEVEAICRRLNDPVGLQTCLGNQAEILQANGNLDGAMQLFKEKEAICRRLNNPAGLQACLGGQALILKTIGNLDGAMRLRKEQEAICRQLNDPAGLGNSLCGQAMILKAIGNLVGAIRLLKEQEAICRQLNDPAGLFVSLGNQALILKDIGDPHGALRLHKEEEAICRRLNDPNGLAISLANQAAILAGNLSRTAEGLRLGEEALRLATKHDLIPLARQIEPLVKQIRRLLK